MGKLLQKLLPDYGIKNIRRFYWLTFFNNSWFILSNWAFFFGLYISREQIGFLDGIAFALSLLLEIPTGAIADLLGKRLTILLSRMFTIISIVIITWGEPGFSTFFIGNMSLFVGFALLSGSKEALGYDSLVEANKTDKYDIVVSRSHILGIVMTAISTLIGGFMYSINPRFPWIAWLVTEAITVVILLGMTEPKVDSYKFNIKNYLRQNWEGVKHLFNENLRPALIYLIPLVLSIEIATGIFRQGIAADYGYDGDTFGYLLAGITLVLTVITVYFDKINKKLGEIKFSLAILVTYLVGFILAYFTRESGLLVGAGMIFILTAARNFIQPLVSSIVNAKISSKYRATTLSVLSILSNIPYIILSIFFAGLTLSSNIGAYYGGLGVIVFVSIIIILISLSLRIARKK